MTGMRRGEVCGLRWSDLNLDKGRIEVRQQLVVLPGQLVFSARTKTDHGRRRIDLDAGHGGRPQDPSGPSGRRKARHGTGYGNEGLVFATPDGSPLPPNRSPRSSTGGWRSTKLPRIRFHDLRHSHVANLIAAGEQPLLIAKRLGHSSSTFTLDRYGHLFECRIAGRHRGRGNGGCLIR